MIALGCRSIYLMMFRYCLLLLPVLITACGQHNTSTSAVARDSSVAESTSGPTGDFYKRFSGTIAGRPVVVQFHRQAGKIHGTYQYSNIGQLVEFRNWLDTVADENYILSEIVPGVQAEGATWAILIQGKTARGEWWSSDSEQHFPISLTEEYPEGSIRLDAFQIADSASLFPDRASSPKAITTHSYLLPAGDQAGFLYDVLRSQIAPGSKEGDDIATAIRAANAAYFNAYRKENALLLDDGDAGLFTFNYTNDEVMQVLYNDQYWLVTELFTASYTGGAHGNYASSYANIDLGQKKIWTVTDIVADTTALRPLLNDAAISYFRLAPGEGMSQRLLVDEVPATANIYLSATGLSFVYNPYEIASYAAGQISLFLPYKKLMPFLTPAFKSRMHLTERAGVAMLRTPTKNY